MSDENALREAALIAAHRTYCECPEPDRVDRQIADAVLAAVVPLVREQVAAEIDHEASIRAAVHTDDDDPMQSLIVGIQFAARIARGGSR